MFERILLMQRRTGSGKSVALWAAMAAHALGAASCSMLMSLDAEQCSTDGDCLRLQSNTQCNLATRTCRSLAQHASESETDLTPIVAAEQPNGDRQAIVFDASTEVATDATATVAAPDDAAREDVEDAIGSVRNPCFNPAGFNGLGCFTCTPTSRVELLNACTEATCEPFDNKKRVKINPDGGAAPGDPEQQEDASLDGGIEGEDGSDQDSDAPNAPPQIMSATPCDTLANPILIAGSSAIKPFIAVIAHVLATQPRERRITLVYKPVGSCSGVDAILNGTKFTGAGREGATYWASSSHGPAERQCDLVDPGSTADIGISDVFPSTCRDLPQGLPPDVLDTLGPIQTMGFVAPSTSSQRSISAEAAYGVFGFGAKSGISPWAEGTAIYHRGSGSGTQQLIAKTIGVPAHLWKGQQVRTTEDLRNNLLATESNSALAEGALGIMSSDYVDSMRSQLRMLAYQDQGQVCGFYPDSTPTSFDKKNVRDGHYPLWGPLHLLTRGATSGDAIRADVRRVVGYISGTTPLPTGARLIPLYAQRGLIPVCAMEVTRTSDGGPIRAVVPTQPCGCFYDVLTTGRSSCDPCRSQADCPSSRPNCSFGYCER